MKSLRSSLMKEGLGKRITRDLEIRLVQKNQEVVKSDISGTASSIIAYYIVTATGDYDTDVNINEKNSQGLWELSGAIPNVKDGR